MGVLNRRGYHVPDWHPAWFLSLGTLMITKKAERLANALQEMPRSENDLEAARMLRQLARVYEVAHEMVYAKTHEQSKAAYCEMIDLIKGKPND